MLYMYMYIFRVYHIRIIAKQNWLPRHETDVFLNNHCQECVRAYLSIHDCLSFLHEVMIGNHQTKTFRHEVMIGNQLEICKSVCMFIVLAIIVETD
jgi:hypothetical protein